LGREYGVSAVRVDKTVHCGIGTRTFQRLSHRALGVAVSAARAVYLHGIPSPSARTVPGATAQPANEEVRRARSALNPFHARRTAQTRYVRFPHLASTSDRQRNQDDRLTRNERRLYVSQTLWMARTAGNTSEHPNALASTTEPQQHEQRTPQRHVESLPSLVRWVAIKANVHIGA
jgi:hypothetical protein